MLFENGSVVGRSEGGGGKREGERLSRVCNEDQSEFRRQWRGEELRQDGFSDSSETDERYWNRSSGWHCVYVCM